MQEAGKLRLLCKPVHCTVSEPEATVQRDRLAGYAFRKATRHAQRPRNSLIVGERSANCDSKIWNTCLRSPTEKRLQETTSDGRPSGRYAGQGQQDWPVQAPGEGTGASHRQIL